jgi:hypothetical protein
MKRVRFLSFLNFSLQNMFPLNPATGNKVKFRAIVVSPKLKPSVIGSIDVHVRDGAGNVVQKWERVFTTQGVFAGEFDLVRALKP